MDTQWVHYPDKLVARISLNSSTPENITVTIPQSYISDLAGNRNVENASLIVYHRPTVGLPSRDVRLDEERAAPKSASTSAGKLLGSVATAAVGGTMAVSSAGGGSGGGGPSVPIFLLNLIQKLYLSSHIGVENMPEIYADFSTQLAWAMFDFPSPFEHFISQNDQPASKAAENGENAEETYWNSITGAYVYIARVFFWVPLIFLSLLLLHLSLLAFCVVRRRRIPFILTFPRLEVMFSYWAMPAITVACASLLRGHRLEALIGVWLLVLFPGSMATWNLFLLWKFFYSRDPRQRLANFVVESSSVPERTLTQIKNEWRRSRAMKKNSKRDPPVVFLNGAFWTEQSVSTAPVVAAASKQLPQIPDGALDAAFSDAECYLYDATYPQSPADARTEWRGEIQPLQYLQPRGLSSASWLSFRSRASEPSTSSGLKNNGCSVHRGWDASSSFTPRHSVELSYATRDALTDTPFSANALNSSDTSINDGGEEWLSIGSIQMKKLADTVHEIGVGTVLGGRSEDKRGWLKYGASDRFQDGTSNNIAALTMQALPLESPHTGTKPSSTPSPRNKAFHSDLRPSPDHWGRAAQDTVPMRQRSLNLGDFDFVERSATPRTKKPEWMTTWALTCSAVPEPAWKSQLWSTDPVPTDDTASDTRDVAELYTPRQRLPDAADGRLSVIAENTGQRSSASLCSGPTASGSAYVIEASTREEKGAPARNEFVDNQLGISIIRPDPYYETGARMIDNQLGISIIRPDPYYETGARMKHIQKECLMDMGLHHLIPPETESSEDEGRSEVEYQARAQGSTHPQSRLSIWSVCGDLCDMGCASLVMGSRQLRGRWVDSPYHDDGFIYKYGYLFEDFRGLPVLYRPASYEIVNGRMDRGKFIPLRLWPLFRWGGWKVPGTQIRFPKIALYHHQLQLLARFLQLTRIILLGASVASVGTGRDCLPQILILLCVCLLLLVVVRIARPFRSRLEMAISLSEEASDVLFLALAALLLLGPNGNSDFRQQVGIGMLAAECGSLMAILLHRLFLALRGFMLARSRHRNRQPTKLSRLFRRYLSRNTYFLQRKYFDRWMATALKRGLYGRPVKREELPLDYLIHTKKIEFQEGLLWWSLEAKCVWKELCETLSAAFHHQQPQSGVHYFDK